MGGYDLVALIFAREVSDSLTRLVKTIDKHLDDSSARKQGQNRLGVFVVFCSDDPNLKQQLDELIVRERLKNIVLSTHNAQGPPRYRIAREAELTVVIYENHNKVAANFVLDDSEDLTASRAGNIIKALTKVLP